MVSNYVIGMIKKENKHIVTYHSRLSFCFRNNTETKQTQTLHTMVAEVSVIGMTQSHSNNRNLDDYGKSPLCLFSFCIIPIAET
jgi:hypothetical protein